MARTTQYIGLSKEAIDYLKKYNALELCKYHMTTGLCQEPVMGSIYECDIFNPRSWPYNYEKDEHISIGKALLVEVVQREIWDAGPMVFTCLWMPNIDKTCGTVGMWSKDEIYERVGLLA